MRHSTPFITAAVAVAALAVHVLPGATAWLQFDRAALARGEVWRLLTGHLTHFGSDHLAWDLGVLVALGCLSEPASRARTGAALVLGAMAVSTALWWWQPQFQYYRGLSGLACSLGGLLAASLLRHRMAAAKFAGALTLVFVAGKCGWEVTTASTFFAAGGEYVPVPLAHLVGLMAGVAAGAGRVRRRRAGSYPAWPWPAKWRLAARRG